MASRNKSPKIINLVYVLISTRSKWNKVQAKKLKILDYFRRFKLDFFMSTQGIRLNNAKSII